MSLTTARSRSRAEDRAAPATSSRRGWIDRHARLLFLAPAILYLAALTVFPFVYSVLLSGTNRNLARPGAAAFVGGANYVALASTPLFHQALLNTAFITVGSIAVELVIGFAIARAFFLIRDRRGVGGVRTLFVLPMMITPVVSGLLWTYILNPTLGITNYVLSVLGLPAFSGFASSSTALISVILVNSWQWTPFMMLLAFAGLSGIAQDQYEAAAIDGAGLWALIRHIELPSIRNLLLIGVMFRVIDNFRLFDVVYVTTRGGPGDVTEVVSMFAYRQMFQFFNVGFASAVAVVILILGLVFANILFRFMRRAEA
ncbi:MAG: carbohydrate ABC transporter permease [Egibacteraceae bacterium]